MKIILPEFRLDTNTDQKLYVLTHSEIEQIVEGLKEGDYAADSYYRPLEKLNKALDILIKDE